MIKNFAIFKTEPKNDKSPTHRIRAKIDDEFIELGACWTKQTANGEKFLSCKLQDVWVDHSDRTKTKKGYAIADEKKIMLDESVDDYPEEKLDEEESPF